MSIFFLLLEKIQFVYYDIQLKCVKHFQDISMKFTVIYCKVINKNKVLPKLIIFKFYQFDKNY